ncbi:hypothetical protein [Marinibacterium profundimaris]|uniref:hypothetical protein n=1 Tax=Marinibacterium profundimaris TaxID=1679460 RepID=UPI001303CF0B|nr:hypothetical protein [Marinibacterium profundimaris]
MKSLFALLALAPVVAAAHQAPTPHAHTDDPLLLMGLGAIAILLVIAVYVKRRS